MVCYSKYLDHLIACALEHSSTHEGSAPVYKDDSKSDAVVSCDVDFSSFCRDGGLPSIASEFTAELPAILLALQISVTLSNPLLLLLVTPAMLFLRWNL